MSIYYGESSYIIGIVLPMFIGQSGRIYEKLKN